MQAQDGIHRLGWIQLFRMWILDPEGYGEDTIPADASGYPVDGKEYYQIVVGGYWCSGYMFHYIYYSGEMIRE